MLSGGRRLACSIGFQPPRGSRRAAPLIPEAERKYHCPFCVSSPAGCHPAFRRMSTARPFGVPAHLHTAGAFRLPQRNVPDEWIFSCQCASEFLPSTYRSRERPKTKSFGKVFQFFLNRPDDLLYPPGSDTKDLRDLFRFILQEPLNLEL